MPDIERTALCDILLQVYFKLTRADPDEQWDFLIKHVLAWHGKDSQVPVDPAMLLAMMISGAVDSQVHA